MPRATDAGLGTDLRRKAEPRPYPDLMVRKEPTPKPAELVNDWPHGDAVDPLAEVARLVALRVTEAMDGRSLRSVGQLTSVDFTALSDLLNGRSWPSALTIARLERGLDADLWPVGAARADSTARTTE
ncbi:hypothetical protein J2X46_002364 [Nocardioides sp. BE266]|uniref:hypothetical protein n=1 Tax=Nocardioides sp. BE266 TaxID=2817725 RepID=UPI002856CD3C|nr:hypothetical protein [Nocardioides sp. BE266]MDR7253379.1 hypothetical protein [Nocardioides sp. BE266]